jgi:spore coat polysaccharide biosynthesis protein SpsF
MQLKSIGQHKGLNKKKSMSKKAIFITVRTASTRLPNKSLLQINGRSTIELLIERIKGSKKADMIVLCTSNKPQDRVLCDIAVKHGIEYFQGSEEDKLVRWLGAARKYDVEFFVTADGDDLFCEPELIDMAFLQYKRSSADFIYAKGLVCGAFTYGIKVAALSKVCQIKGTSNTEMMWVYFTDTGLFMVEDLQNVPEIFKRPEIRMTLDYEDDLRFFKAVVNHFEREKAKKDYTLRDIINWLDSKPEVIRINQHLQQEFLANQRAKTRLVLKGGRV